jgi:hypothetical protein
MVHNSIGRYGAPWTPEAARNEAKRLLGLVVAGEDPAEIEAAGRIAVSVSELCDQYLQEAEAGRLLTRRKCAKKSSNLKAKVGRSNRLGRANVFSGLQQSG